MNAPVPAPRTRPDAATIAGLTAALRAVLGDRVTASPAVREQHANQLTWAPCEPPDLVVFPHSTAEVQAVVRACAERDVPIVPYGVGTSLEGHVNAPFGGVSIDTGAMNRVRAVHADDLDCTVEAGVTRRALNAYLRDTGLFFPIDPGADATIGGMAATRASGTNAVRYGTMKDAVLGLTAVMPNGDIVTTARRARKSSAGYDLTRLLVGSEGTLGIITEVTLRLHGIPEAISAGICPFPSIKAACDATILTIQSGIPVARIELLDEVQVAACNRYSKLALPETPLLLVEFHGTDAGVREQAERFGEIAADLGGGPFDWATGADERARLWQARHDVYWASIALRPGPTIKNMSTDVCVPISRLAARGMRGGDEARHRRDRAHGADRRPCRRRQLPHPAARRCRQPRGDVRGGRLPRPARRPRAGPGRHLHGRARDRPEEDALHGKRARAGGARPHADPEARDRPPEPHESRQADSLTRPATRRRRPRRPSIPSIRADRLHRCCSGPSDHVVRSSKLGIAPTPRAGSQMAPAHRGRASARAAAGRAIR